MNKYIILLFLFLHLSNIYSQDIIGITDRLEHAGKHKEALRILRENFNKNNPDIRICWRIARNTFEISNTINEKDEKIELFEEGIDVTKPYFGITDADKRDRAELIHWYAVNYASKIKLLGIFGGRESLRIVPVVFSLMDKCQEIDPTYAGAYFFRAKLMEEVPFFLGGDKFEMTNNYYLALKYANEEEKLLMLFDTAAALYNRNWDVDKKSSKADRKNVEFEKYAFNDLNDRDFSYKLLLEAKELYEKKDDPSEKEKMIYNDTLRLLKERL